MTMAKKIGLMAFIISEIIMIASIITVLILLIKGIANVDDLAMVIYAQTGILGIVWGSQGIVNYAKNKQPKQTFVGNIPSVGEDEQP